LLGGTCTAFCTAAISKPLQAVCAMVSGRSLTKVEAHIAFAAAKKILRCTSLTLH
jgi:hypothetical protein